MDAISDPEVIVIVIAMLMLSFWVSLSDRTGYPATTPGSAP
jgi:hypothetical protein